MKKHKILSTWVGLMAILLATSCSQGTNENGGNSNNLPQAKGAPSEVYVVMDSAYWYDEIGEAVKSTFAEAIPGLPREEPIFALKYVNPAQFSGYLRQATNLIFVTTLDNESLQGRKMKNFFTENSLQMIRENPEKFRHVIRNQYANGQIVLHLFGKTREQLYQQILQNKEVLQQVMLSEELKRLTTRLYAGKEETGLMNQLLKNHDFFLNIPAGYKLAKQDDNFLWIRNYTPQIDKNIVVYYQDYKDPSVFEDEGIFELREKMAFTHLRDVEKASIYMVTETLVPISTRNINFDDKYAVEVRGLWKLSDLSMGGPFLGYLFVDETRNRLYYIEGYVASPGKNKRDDMREMEIILETFKTREEYQEMKK